MPEGPRKPVRVWQYAVPVVVAVIPLALRFGRGDALVVNLRESPVLHQPELVSNAGKSLSRSWWHRRVLRFSQRVRERLISTEITHPLNEAVRLYVVETVKSLCQSDEVVTAASGLLEEAMAQPAVTTAMEAKFAEVLESPASKEATTHFFDRLFSSPEFKKILTDRMRDPEIQQQLGECLVSSVKMVLGGPWWNKSRNKN